MAINNLVQPGIRVRDWIHDAFYLDEFHPADRNPLTQCRISELSRLPNATEAKDPLQLVNAISKVFMKPGTVG